MMPTIPDDVSHSIAVEGMTGFTGKVTHPCVCRIGKAEPGIHRRNTVPHIPPTAARTSSGLRMIRPCIERASRVRPPCGHSAIENLPTSKVHRAASQHLFRFKRSSVDPGQARCLVEHLAGHQLPRIQRNQGRLQTRCTPEFARQEYYGHPPFPSPNLWPQPRSTSFPTH